MTMCSIGTEYDIPTELGVNPNLKDYLSPDSRALIYLRTYTVCKFCYCEKSAPGCKTIFLHVPIHVSINFAALGLNCA